jgi:PAS domain S-box-containing protein
MGKDTYHRQLTFQYIFALSIVIILGIVCLFFLQKTTAHQEDNVNEINLLGKQRMLSQRIAFFSTQLVSASNTEEIERHRRNLFDTVLEMEKAHELLINYELTTGLKTIYFSPPLNLDQQVRQYISHTKTLLATVFSSLNKNHPDYLYIQEQAGGTLIAGLEQVVIQREKELIQEIKNLQTIQWVAFLLVLVTLIGVGIFIFRPMVRRISAERRFSKGINDAVPELIYIFDIVENKTVYSNREITLILGYDSQEIQALGSNVLPKLIHPEDLKTLTAHYTKMQTAKDGEIRSYEVRVQHKNGEWRWVMTRETVYARNVLGEVTQVLGASSDITARKQAEESAQKQYEYVEALYETMLGLLNRLELSDVLEIIMDKALHLLNTEHGALCLITQTDKKLRAVVTRGVSQLYQNYLYRKGEGINGTVWQTGESLVVLDFPNWQNSLAYLKKDNLSIHKGLAVPLKVGEEVIGTISVFYTDEAVSVRDREVDLLKRFAQMASIALDNAQLYTSAQTEIKERKLTEEALAQARDQALVASRLKSEFLANTSHEIRTPINAIIGLTELLLDTEMTNQQRELVQITMDSAQILLSLIGDILDFSKIEADKLDLDEVEFEPLKLVEETVELLTTKAGEKQLELICYVDPDLPRAVIGDPVRIRQVLMNLLSNALKFTEQGEIIVRVTLEAQYERTATIRFEVTDTGIGMTEDTLQRIFRPFTQADSSTTRKYGGTGLGLSICSRLVEMMGGKLEVQSKLDKGTNFVFALNFPVAVFTHPPVSLSQLSVLVTSASGLNAEIIQNYLKSWHIQPTVIKFGREALVFLHNKQFDLVVFDLETLEINQAEILHYFTDDPQLANTSVIFLTPFNYQKMAIQSPNVKYLYKPVRQSQLFNAINTLVQGKTVLEISLESATPSKLTPSSNRRFLLVEDNMVNQKLVLMQLNKLGYYNFEVANNGLEAVDKTATQNYDLILMDCQMPLLDGYEATRQIRGNGTFTPIIAMTANAMKGDMERCLNAGMDGYLTKPLMLKELRNTLNRWLPETLSLPKPEPTPVLPPSTNGKIEENDLDLAKLDETIINDLIESDDEESVIFLKGLIKSFLENSMDILHHLRYAIDNALPNELQSYAHKLRGSSATFGATAFADLCYELELIGKADTTVGADKILARLETAYSLISSSLHQFTPN